MREVKFSKDRSLHYVVYGRKHERVYGKMIKCALCGRDTFKTAYSLKVGGRFCSPQCAGKAYMGDKSPKWKGGTHIRQGYVFVRTPPKHTCKRRYIEEHRLVIEKTLGRYLKSSEFVHHLNGDKKDNRLENLALCSRQNHFEFIKKLQRRIHELEIIIYGGIK